MKLSQCWDFTVVVNFYDLVLLSSEWLLRLLHTASTTNLMIIWLAFGKLTLFCGYKGRFTALAFSWRLTFLILTLLHIREVCHVLFLFHFLFVGFYFHCPQSLSMNITLENLECDQGLQEPHWLQGGFCWSILKPFKRARGSQAVVVTEMRYNCKMSNIYLGPELFSCH